MSIENLYYNPFALNTASAAWNNRESHPASRVVNTVVGALTDICLKNPYDLTIGNARSTFFSAETRTKTEKVACIAIIAVGSLYSLMLYGSNSYLAGRSLVAIGINTAFPHLAKVGYVLQIVGEKVFLAGAVPLYGVLYALPKKMIESLPRIVQFIADKVSATAQWIFNHVLVPIWNQAIRPVLQLMNRVVCSIGNAIRTAVEAVARQIDQVAKWVFKNLLQPLWNHIIEPFLNLFGGTIEKIASAVSNTVRYIAIKAAKLFLWIVENVIAPLCNRVIGPFISLIGRTIEKIATAFGDLLQFIAKRADQLATWIVKNILAPLWNRVISPLIHTFTRTIQFIAEKAARCATWIFQNLLAPCFNAIEKAASSIGKALLDYAIRPIGNALYFIAQKVASVAQVIFDRAIAPLARALESAFTALGNKVYEVSNATLEGIAASWRNAANFFGI